MAGISFKETGHYSFVGEGTNTDGHEIVRIFLPFILLNRSKLYAPAKNELQKL